MWAASPARNRLPKRIGSTTKERLRTQRAQCEPPFVRGVDQLRRDWLGARQYAEPTERIVTLEHPDLVFRDRLAAHAVEAVATHDVVAVDTHDLPAYTTGEIRLRPIDIMRSHVLGVVHHDATEAVASLIQIARQFRLPVDDYALATG